MEVPYASWSCWYIADLATWDAADSGEVIVLRDSFPVEPFGLSGARNTSLALEDRLGLPVRALFWAGMSDFIRYPHVQHFESLPSLIAGILRCDLLALSTAMRKAHTRRAASSAATWRIAVADAIVP